MTIRRCLSVVLVLALLLPSVSGAGALLAPADSGHGCCPSEAAAATEGRTAAGQHDGQRCGPACPDGHCASCAQCTGIALPVSTQTRCPVAPSAAPGFVPTPFLAFFPPVELRPPRALV
jgi:hypothetical protein